MSGRPPRMFGSSRMTLSNVRRVVGRPFRISGTISRIFGSGRRPSRMSGRPS